MATLAQALSTMQGSSLALAYGTHVVRGTQVISQTLASKNQIGLYLFGEGEWSGPEYVWLNRIPADNTDTNIFHFHPGVDGVLGHGLTPDSTGGDNLVDTFFSQLPGFTATTFSRIACLFVNAPPDPRAPSATMDLVGRWRCLKVRYFDASGNQINYDWTQNGAWHMLDVILRKHIKPQWLTSAAAAAGGDLTAAEKARIDFPSVFDANNWCSALIASGDPRFLSNVAFTQSTSVKDALTQLGLVSQLYCFDTGGKIYIRADQPRAYSFTLKSSHIKAGTWDSDKKSLHSAPNRFLIKIRDTDPQKVFDIETAANSGLVRASGILTVKTKGAVQHPFQIGDYVTIVKPDDAGFAGIIVVTAYTTSTITGAQAGANATSGGGYAGTEESKYAESLHTENHEQHQLAVGQRGVGLAPQQSFTDVTYDLGAMTRDQAERIARHLKTRNLGMDQSPYIAPRNAQVTARMDAVDDSNNALASQFQGEIIHVDKSVTESDQGDYEIIQSAWTFAAADASSQGDNYPYIELQLLEYVSGSYSDTSNTAPALSPSILRGDLPPVPTVGNNLLANPGFEIGGDNQFHTSVGCPLASDLEITANPSLLCQFKIVIGDGNARSGNAYLLIRLAAGVSVPTGTTEFRASTRSKIPVRVGDPIRIDSYRRWDQSAAVPASVTIQQTASVVYFASDGTELGTAGPSVSNSVQTSFAAFGGGDTVPATLSGQVPAYCKVIFRMIVTNSTGGALNTGVNTYADLKFDDIVFTVQLSPFQADPTVAPVTAQGSNPMAQSGTTTTINFSASTQQFPEGAISINSGSTSGSGYNVRQFCWADMPIYAGGAVTYHASANNYDVTGQRGRIYTGVITLQTTGGGLGIGGGNGACTADGTMIRQADGSDALIEQCFQDFLAGKELKWLSPWGWDVVLSIEKLDDVEMHDLKFDPTPALDRYKNTLRCSGATTVKVWGLWEHVEEIYMGGRQYKDKDDERKHIHDVRGIRISVDGGVANLAMRTAAGKGSVYKVKLRDHHVYLANGVWNHNSLKS